MSALTAETKHTPGPWYFEADVGIRGHWTIWSNVNGVKTFVADCYDSEEARDDAAFIVNAANHHTQLLNALASILWEDSSKPEQARITDRVVASAIYASARAEAQS